MLIVTFHNDGTGEGGRGNYNAEVFINYDLLWKGRVEGHVRDEGWPALLAALAAQVTPRGEGA